MQERWSWKNQPYKGWIYAAGVILVFCLLLLIVG